jgi:hypothetical protein
MTHPYVKRRKTKTLMYGLRTIKAINQTRVDQARELSESATAESDETLKAKQAEPEDNSDTLQPDE